MQEKQYILHERNIGLMFFKCMKIISPFNPPVNNALSLTSIPENNSASMTRGTRLNDIVRCCETRFNRGDAAAWKHGDFVDLNREIQRDTNVNISPSTLKRIFGKITVDDDYIPQQATLEALKKYGRFTETDHPLPAITPSATAHPVGQSGFTRHFKPVYLLLITGTVIACLLGWWYLKPGPISGKISFTHAEGHLPATAFFELEVPNTADSLFINFGDKSPLLYLRPGEKKSAHIYYIPGVFNITLQSRHQTIDTASVYIPSDNWIGFACHRQDDIPLHFFAFPADRKDNDSVFEFTNNQLNKMGLDTTGPVLSRLCNYTPVKQEGDDFVFEATFKNNLSEKGIYCRSTQFQISGANSMIRFRLVNAGCSQRVLNVLSEQTFKGTINDLSQFVADLSQWNTVKLINQQKQATLYVNNKPVFSGSYQQPLGELKGLFLEFEGTGQVKSCELKSGDGKLIYRF
jgi:hypothetical protein